MTDVLHASRHDVRDSRKIELITGPRAHRSQLRALRAVTNLCHANAGLAALVNKHFDRENTPPSDAEEYSWLQLSDIAVGRHFDEASLPPPSLPRHDPSIYHSNLNRPSSQPLWASDTTRATPENPQDVTASADPTSTDLPDLLTTGADRRTASDLSQDVQNGLLIPETYVEKAASHPDGPSTAPSQVAPPEPEEEAQLSGSTQRMLDLQSPSKPAKVVHLPSKEAQEERAREMEEERRQRGDDETMKSTRAGLSHLSGEQASSPSSTIGAYSAATPGPPQESPDTSPDSEPAERLEISKEIRPSPEEQREKEEHDRLLEAQKDIARKNALGDVSTADDQLRWEEREAAARDAEEKVARESDKGPEPSAIMGIGETEAEEVVDGVRTTATADQTATAPTLQASQATHQLHVPTSGTKGPDEGDNITVAPRLAAEVMDATAHQSRDDEIPARRQTLHPDDAKDMIARTSSGLANKHGALELSHSTTPTTRTTSDMLPTSPFHLATPTGLADTLNDPEACLEKLDALKGAASDPTRDYLEPLFRIQAHDSPNINTTPLSDLIRSASKSVTTADHYAMIEERADYKILRRIYQLQNANKWSLRQMEKAREPPQPISHHDHMMAEMKWLQKDFRVERKMKKSICAWLAQRCAAWCAADAAGKRAMQVQVKPPPLTDVEVTIETVPDLESPADADSPEDEDDTPPTPQDGPVAPLNLVVPPQLRDSVADLQKSGKLGSALLRLPVARFDSLSQPAPARAPLTAVSKYAASKILPQFPVNPCKRSRFDYADDDELLSDERESKRLRDDRALPAEDVDTALFHPENKHLRDRLHANTAFRPPSEFVMPSTSFYEFRNGSQWIWEDDQKLRKLAKDYSFNWSLIADELTLPAMHKSSAERRTPWECFERWVELEQLPAEMKKTVYFKTWYQRLEQSQQASDRRYQAQLAALQAQNNGQAAHVPQRRRIVPTRVDKRKNSRYLWLVDAMRKLARKKEQQAFKQAESQRAAAQRKNQADTNQPAMKMLTPQQFSKKRYERDCQMAEAARAHRQKLFEQHQQRQALLAKQAQQAQQQQQGMQNAVPNQQRPSNLPSNMPTQHAQMQANNQQTQNMNIQMQQQARQQLPVATRNGHLAVPQVNGQGMPQVQMRPNGQMPTVQDMQRMAQANAQVRHQFGQPYQQMPNGIMSNPGNGAQMTTQQQLQNNQALLAAMQQQQQQQQQHQPQHQPQQNMQANHMSNGQQSGTHQQISGSPSMPPPPTPQSHPQALSSGRVPQILKLQQEIRGKYPQISEDQVQAMATQLLKDQSVSSSQVRQNAMNAAAGISGGGAPQAHANNVGYSQHQVPYQNNQQMSGSGSPYMNSDGSGQQAAGSPQQYAALLRQRQMAQMRMQQQQSPVTNHAQLAVNGSPSMAHASPNMAPASPSMQFSSTMAHGQMNGMPNMSGMSTPQQQQQQQQRPPSRSNTPQMQRLGSSGSVPGMPSPQGGMQGSPHMQAGMAR